MMTTDHIYTEAILFMLDSMSPNDRIQLKDDIRLKQERLYELNPVTIQALERLQGLIRASEMTRTMGD
tara:strand:+ start:778 stop:981 length:204 start_codon:yes stop_codon:yes gene_type:complete